ncbi:MAG TPA: ABC transporter ATP-binding protein [Acidisoma sp.]|uniref:ABC transporter ATP-binding protein n=1 Tax=Acidisoma sp. TaxID=1872115 RepID=UPI002BD6B8E1|nr:ABC transporter ATP-binding protein [Acidisoma sp.]HTI00533.1 ABC transporter ATP-binding protein [Acidisoma sp.]
MSASGPVLEARGLNKRFGGVVAASAIDFTLHGHELRCVIGPNGAGKSTFFSLLCGIQKPDSGSILLHGQDVTRLEPFRRVRSGLGLTFQTNRAYHKMTVGENLETARRGGTEEDAAPYRAAISAFGLAGKQDLPAALLAHHELQWLEITMALRQGPGVLLLDEPTAGMSPNETMRTAEVLRELNAAGLAIVVVEHDIAFVRAVAQTVTVLHQGAVFAEGTVEEITAREDVRAIYLGKVREKAR